MQYMTLLEMRDMLRDEANISRNVAHGVTQIDQQNRLIIRTQQDLYLNYDWPHLKAVAAVTLEPAQRYAAYPDTFVFEGIDFAWWREVSSDNWAPLGYGITALELNEIDSDSDETETDARRWQNYMQPAEAEEHPDPDPPITGDTLYNMFEVWPIPTNGGTVRFQGKRALLPLTADDKTSTLDGPTIVLHAAAEILARQKSEDAPMKFQIARERLRLLRLREVASDTRQANLAGGSGVPQLRPGLDYLNKV